MSQKHSDYFLILEKAATKPNIYKYLNWISANFVMLHVGIIPEIWFRCMDLKGIWYQHVFSF